MYEKARNTGPFLFPPSRGYAPRLLLSDLSLILLTMYASPPAITRADASTMSLSWTAGNVSTESPQLVT